MGGTWYQSYGGSGDSMRDSMRDPSGPVGRRFRAGMREIEGREKKVGSGQVCIGIE